MTRKEFVAIALASNPNMNRRQKAIVKITSPVLVKITNRMVDNTIEATIEALETERQTLAK